MDSILERLPTEVLERIAFFNFTHEPVGPPDIFPLLSACKAIHGQLAPNSNPALYADVFRAKFDTAAIRRRLGPWEPSSTALRDELVRRFTALKRIRKGAARGKYPVDESPSPFVAEADDERDLWTLLLIMFEDDGLNVRQAREYGQAHEWLSAYWIRALRKTVPQQPGFVQASTGRPWIPDSGRNALAMWSFWILLRPDDQDPQMHDVLRILSLAGHRFSLVSPPWSEYEEHLHPILHPSIFAGYLGHPDLVLSPPPLSAPAVCSFYGLENMPRARRQAYNFPLIHSTDPLPPALPSAAPRGVRGSYEWDVEFNRLIRLGLFHTARRGVNGPLSARLLGTGSDRTNALCAFRPGSLHGVWEGMFMYTEFQTYAALLMGASWNAIERVDVAQHRQTWRLREHHLLGLAADTEEPAGNAEPMEQMMPPLPAGEPLDAHIPQPLLMEEAGGKLKLYHDGHEHVYDTWAGGSYVAADAVPEGRVRYVRDVIVTGEGHSSWGQFTLRGRVRPLDGFISVVKRYTDGAQRGDWLYRALLVGDKHGNLAGRWRETLTHHDQNGYEGCFTLSRRG